MGLEKMVRWLKLCTALVDLNLVSNTQIRWLTTARNPSLGESYASGLHGHPNSDTHTLTQGQISLQSTLKTVRRSVLHEPFTLAVQAYTGTISKIT